ncbi:MAG: hypothetical protein JWL64_1268 [Frankiales bacterium]|nr:hypothetical protein [Frankiales bacterium]
MISPQAAPRPSLDPYGAGMLLADGVLALAELALIVYCVLNVITTPESEVRNLPKMIWLLLVILVPIVGPIAWLVAGRPVTASTGLPYKGNRGIPPEYDRPNRAAAHSPDDDEAFLSELRRKADAQRAEGQRQRAEQRAREEQERHEP